MDNTAQQQTTALRVDTWCINNFKGNSDFDGMRWVISARSKDPLRRNICCVLVEGGLVVATDGYRLHMFTPAMIDTHDGLWIVAKVDKSLIVLQRDESGIEYPDYARLFNGIGINTRATRLYCNGAKDADMIILTRVVWEIYRTTGHCFNIKFVQDAVMCLDDVWHYWMANKSLIIVNDDTSKAIILMPLKDA